MLFKERISYAIKSSGLTQKEIAKELNISEGNITNWKKGENLPSIEILYKLCILLNESSDYLLGLDEYSNL
ncbi:MAG: helix-turn-helix transcriptional regulator [Clostridiales bacterium]|nr:helix-turn-helix transcriptional regulator [Clostridiales bacterium]